MAKSAERLVIPNQVFIGLPWKNVRPKYERVIDSLKKKYPLYFTIVGRDDGVAADDLFALIKERMASSSYAIFDATGGNANVSLEYGFAEGIDLPRSIFLSSHKSAASGNDTTPIISDLGGKRRIQYKNQKGLSKQLATFSRDHDYTKRFESALTRVSRRKTKGAKKRVRALALKVVHFMDGQKEVRRPDLIQHLQGLRYKQTEIESLLTGLHREGVIQCTVGKYSKVLIH